MCDQIGIRINPNFAPEVRIQTALVNDSNRTLPDLADVGIPRVTADRADRPCPYGGRADRAVWGLLNFSKKGLTRKASPFAWIASNSRYVLGIRIDE